MAKKILEQFSYNKNLDLGKIDRALDIVDKAGINSQKLLNLILPLNPDEDTICSTLLADAYCKGLIKTKNVKETFGETIFEILNGIKKLDELKYVENDKVAQLEILRRMFVVIAKDLRVIFVAIVYRIFKMDTLMSKMDPKSSRIFANETLDIYAPIAGRLGIYKLKIKLEDFAFKYSKPEEYEDINNQLNNVRQKCKISIALIKSALERFFEQRGINAEVSGRIKSIYGIYTKLKRKGLNNVNDLYDLFAIRVVLPCKTTQDGVHLVDHLYSLLGLIHSEWRPLSRKFKDYIAIPKENGYKSLHTVVLGLAPKDMDQPVEIQMRDTEMHKNSEYGIAAHWIYKDSVSSDPYDSNIRSQIEWINALQTIQDELKQEGSIKGAEMDLFKDHIFVLTPRGEIKDLPVGSTPLDFAYLVHTDVGNHCVMAKVDEHIVSLDYELKNGEVVEIIIKKDAAPRLQWLAIAKTITAKNKIRAYFSNFNKNNNVKDGRNLLNEQLTRLGKSKLDQNYSILKKYLGKNLSLTSREKLVAEVGNGSKLASEVIKKIYPYEDLAIKRIFSKKKTKTEEISDINLPEKINLENYVLVGGEAGLPIKIASCCRPKMGDKIVGYVTNMKIISIHRTDCVKLNFLNEDRMIFAGWKGEDKPTHEPNYIVGIKLTAIDRMALTKDVSSVIASFNFNIRQINAKKLTEGVFEQYFVLEVDDVNRLDKFLDKLEQVKGVLKVIIDNTLKDS